MCIRDSAGPDPAIYVKLGLEPEQMDAIGILTITPSEGAIIAADIATKASDIVLGFIDRFSGALVFTGDISSVEAAVTVSYTHLRASGHFSCPDFPEL